MSIYLRGAVFWIDVHCKGQRHQEGVGKTRAEAEARHAEVLLALKAGVPVVKAAPIELPREVGQATVLEALQLTERLRWSSTRAHGKKNQIARLKDFHAVPLSSLAVEHVAAFVKKQRERGLKDSSIKRNLTPLFTALNTARRAGLGECKADLSVVTETLKPWTPRTRTYTPAQMAQMLDYLANRKRYDPSVGPTYKTRSIVGYFKTAFATGARMSELLAVKPGDLQEDGWIRLGETKTDTPRLVPVDPALIAELKALPRSKRGHVFDINDRTIRRVWKSLKRVLGYADDPEVVPYVARHTVATELVRSVPIKTAMTILGHTQVSTTMKYTHLDKSDLEKARAVLSRQACPPTDFSYSPPAKQS